MESGNRLLGYARVSTVGQTLAAQLEQLKSAGCEKIYREKVTGARADRRELCKMLTDLDASDVVTVTRIDRLARSTFDLFAIVKRIADTGAQFRSLAEPWADTSTSTGRLMLAVLGGLADVERDLIRTRTAEGRSRAKAAGKRLGRRPKKDIWSNLEKLTESIDVYFGDKIGNEAADLLKALSEEPTHVLDLYAGVNYVKKLKDTNAITPDNIATFLKPCISPVSHSTDVNRSLNGLVADMKCVIKKSIKMEVGAGDFSRSALMRLQPSLSATASASR
jgi:DNA invertase Pin-like site-specific DNA recombinase